MFKFSKEQQVKFSNTSVVVDFCFCRLFPLEISLGFRRLPLISLEYQVISKNFIKMGTSHALSCSVWCCYSPCVHHLGGKMSISSVFLRSIMEARNFSKKKNRVTIEFKKEILLKYRVWHYITHHASTAWTRMSFLISRSCIQSHCIKCAMNWHQILNCS